MADGDAITLWPLPFSEQTAGRDERTQRAHNSINCRTLTVHDMPQPVTAARKGIRSPTRNPPPTLPSCELRAPTRRAPPHPIRVWSPPIRLEALCVGVRRQPRAIVQVGTVSLTIVVVFSG